MDPANKIFLRYKGQANCVNLQILKTEPGTCDLILVEGRKEELELVGHFILAVATGYPSLQIGPDVAWGDFFSKKTSFGLYVHRVDSEDELTSKATAHPAKRTKKRSAPIERTPLAPRSSRSQRP